MITDSHRHQGRVVITDVQPAIDGGRFPIKRVVSDIITVQATVIADGHDALGCALLVESDRHPAPRAIAMKKGPNDVWSGQFEAEGPGQMSYTVEGWVDRFGTWRRDFEKRIAAKQDVRIELQIGSTLIHAAAEQADDKEAKLLSRYADLLADKALPVEERTQLALGQDIADLMDEHPDRSTSTTYDKKLLVTVDPSRARFSAWYEIFPRSCSSGPGVHGTFRDCEQALPSIASMGFDVVYLPPIHPIGVSHRKGPNNANTAAAQDVGSPWAIGGDVGGHTAVHPQLGTLDDFQGFVDAARRLDLDVALDIAFQCSPDHPYVKQHPEWFRQRPDGTIQYAENPPKKYEDIYPFDFDTAAWEPLWDELLNVVNFWIGQGVRIFRVDNPHTKPLSFWEWLIARVKKENPDVIFLSEAFTRPALMYQLAKIGFSQSYNYFPWKNTKSEIQSYFTELVSTNAREYFRSNLWPNTPDILTEFLQRGGRSGFAIRFMLAATLGANYGIYGPAFELCENQPKEPGSEEYLNSEKYEIKHWDTERAGNLRALITRVNQIRHAHPALQRDDTLAFHPCSGDQLICFSKRALDGEDIVVAVVNIDPRQTHAAEIALPLEDWNIDAAEPYRVRDLLTGISYLWRGSRQFVELNPNIAPGHLFALEK
jgi:starch synthase (maltosyl-transferring)